MAYKARFKRRDDGGYDASFGRQSKAITGYLSMAGNREWAIVSGFGAGRADLRSKRISDVKARWAELAAAEYSGAAAAATTPAPLPTAAPSRAHHWGGRGSPQGNANVMPICDNCGLDMDQAGEICTPARRSGPPRIKAKPALHPQEQHEQGPQPLPDATKPLLEGGRLTVGVGEYEPNPFDPLMFERVDGKFYLTPVGALEMIHAWTQHTGLDLADCKFPVDCAAILERTTGRSYRSNDGADTESVEETFAEKARAGRFAIPAPADEA